MSTLCIFDLDGTLLNTIEGIHHHLSAGLTSQGLPGLTIEQAQALVGHGLKNLVTDSLRTLHQDIENSLLVQQVLEGLLSSYSADPTIGTFPYPGIPQVLERLKSNGHTLAVVTNKDQTLAKILSHHFFPQVFFSVIGLSPDWPRKPDPASSRFLIQESGAKNSIFIGDSEVDIQTAKAAGIPSVGVTWGFRSLETIQSVDPEWIVGQADQLIPIINSL